MESEDLYLYLGSVSNWLYDSGEIKVPQPLWVPIFVPLEGATSAPYASNGANEMTRDGTAPPASPKASAPWKLTVLITGPKGRMRVT